MAQTQSSFAPPVYEPVTITSRPIAIDSNFTSPVSIIIPYHSKYELLMELLSSIFRFTRSNYYDVCVVDDNSPNVDFFHTLNRNATKNAEKRKSTLNFKAVRLPEQKGFAGALRAGFEATESPYVCFMNSDCRVEDISWLRNMGECLLQLKSQGVRMVSPMTNNSADGHPSQQADKFFRSPDHVVLDTEEYLSLYCFMCHRELFAHCGGFLKEYPFGNFEDQEIAARMQKYGFKQAVCRNSWVYHKGAATIHELQRAHPKLRKVMNEENRQRCIEDLQKLKTTA